MPSDAAIKKARETRSCKCGPWVLLGCTVAACMQCMDVGNALDSVHNAAIEAAAKAVDDTEEVIHGAMSYELFHRQESSADMGSPTMRPAALLALENAAAFVRALRRGE